jgi:hypothetical protein
MPNLTVISELTTIELIEPLNPTPYETTDTPKIPRILAIDKEITMHIKALEHIGLMTG